jgi:hypothetical protein
VNIPDAIGGEVVKWGGGVRGALMGAKVNTYLSILLPPQEYGTDGPDRVGDDSLERQ